MGRSNCSGSDSSSQHLNFRLQHSLDFPTSKPQTMTNASQSNLTVLSFCCPPRSIHVIYPISAPPRHKQLASLHLIPQQQQQSQARLLRITLPQTIALQLMRSRRCSPSSRSFPRSCATESGHLLPTMNPAPSTSQVYPITSFLDPFHTQHVRKTCPFSILSLPNSKQAIADPLPSSGLTLYAAKSTTPSSSPKNTPPSSLNPKSLSSCKQAKSHAPKP